MSGLDAYYADTFNDWGLWVHVLGNTRFLMSYTIEDELRVLQLLFQKEQAYRRLLEQTGTEAQSTLDWLQQLIDAPGISAGLRASICQTMVRLAKKSGLCPSCLTIQGVARLGEHPVDGGGFGDIWKGRLEGVDDQLVCLKVVKVYLMKDIKRLLKNYLREAIIWRQLKHPNILPCLGLYYLDDTRQRICLVSPWMDNGNLSEFLQGRPRQSIDHLRLMHDITNGLSYLHDCKIIHGDLKSVNILITSSQRACIADFGLSSVADSQIFRVTSTTAQVGGTARWCAPELHSSEPATKKCDIYSCGCLFYEIITGLPPFHELKRDPAIVLAVLRGERPSKPENDRIPDDLWSLVSSCWESDPNLRPTAEDILQRLPPAESLPAEDWDDKLFIELRRNIISRLTWVGHQYQEVLEILAAADIIEEPDAKIQSNELSSHDLIQRSGDSVYGDYGSVVPSSRGIDSSQKATGCSDVKAVALSSLRHFQLSPSYQTTFLSYQPISFPGFPPSPLVTIMDDTASQIPISTSSSYSGFPIINVNGDDGEGSLDLRRTKSDGTYRYKRRGVTPGSSTNANRNGYNSLGIGMGQNYIPEAPAVSAGSVHRTITVSGGFSGRSVRTTPYPRPNVEPHGRMGGSSLQGQGSQSDVSTGNSANRMVTENLPSDDTRTAKASHSRRYQEVAFVCPVPGCGSTFTRSFNLKGHIRSHNEEKPFICGWPGCGKGFARQHDCKRHEQLHTNYRPFTCEGCQKPFARMDALNRHLRSEGGAECQRVLEQNGGSAAGSPPIPIAISAGGTKLEQQDAWKMEERWPSAGLSVAL